MTGPNPMQTPSVEVSELDDGLVICDRIHGMVHRLSPSASIIFDLCDGTRTPEAIASALGEIYGRQPPPTRETLIGLRDLADRGLVRWNNGPRHASLSRGWSSPGLQARFSRRKQKQRAATSGYDAAAFWTGVAHRLRARVIDPDLSGSAGPFHRYKHQVSLDRLFNLLPVADATVLEFGCGPGGNLRALSDRRPARLVGADISWGMVRLARTNTSAEIVQLDRGNRLPFADQQFDCAFTHAVLQHVPDASLRGVVGELTRVTRSTLVLIEDTAALRERSAGGSYWVRHDQRYISLATEHGFRLRDVTRSNIWASEATWIAIRRLLSTFEPTTRAEGQRASEWEYRLERAALLMTRHLDRLLPQMSGKSALRFERVSSLQLGLPASQREDPEHRE